MNEAQKHGRAPGRDPWYRWVVKSISGYAIFSTDLDGRIVTWDDGAELLFGYRRDDVIGENARFIFTPDDIDHQIPEGEMACAAASRSAPDERWHVKKDGTVFWASGLMMRIMDDHKRHVGYAKVIRECTHPGPM